MDIRDRRAVRTNAAALLVIASLVVPWYAPAGQKSEDWNPILPRTFVGQVDNPYFPLPVGRTLRYRNETQKGTETLEVEVTSGTKVVLGVATTVVVERHALDGEIEEISENWFAQDGDGNVWYFGEFSQVFQDGTPVSTEGSWEAGVDGARPGIIMKARPAVGDSHFQELAPGVAEDQARVMSAKRSESVPYGTFDDVLLTKEWTALEPGSVEHKSYARGIGLIKEEGGPENMELIEVIP